MKLTLAVITRTEPHQDVIDYFGSQLVKAGYNYYGNEPMYSGITGTLMRADIYFGVASLLPPFI